MTRVLIRRGENTERHRKEENVKMEVDIGVMYLQAKEFEGLTTFIHKKPGEKHGAFFCLFVCFSSSEASEGTILADYLISSFYPPKIIENKF